MPMFIDKTGEVKRPGNRKHHKPKGFGISVTETAGAMTMKQQIDRLRAAQIVQGHWKREKYPTAEELPDDFWPPEYGSDEMDAIMASRKVLNGMQKAQARQEAVNERKAREEAARAAEQPIVEEPTQPVE